ncbi:uncharacterized, partial [Tachysurus ichikawai]
YYVKTSWFFLRREEKRGDERRGEERRGEEKRKKEVSEDEEVEKEEEEEEVQGLPAAVHGREDEEVTGWEVVLTNTDTFSMRE